MKQYSETRKARTKHRNMRLNIASKFMHPHEIRFSIEDETIRAMNMYVCIWNVMYLRSRYS